MNVTMKSSLPNVDLVLNNEYYILMINKDQEDLNTETSFTWENYTYAPKNDVELQKNVN